MVVHTSLVVFGSAPLSSRTFTTSVQPWRAAKWSVVKPCECKMGHCVYFMTLKNACNWVHTHAVIVYSESTWHRYTTSIKLLWGTQVHFDWSNVYHSRMNVVLNEHLEGFMGRFRVFWQYSQSNLLWSTSATYYGCYCVLADSHTMYIHAIAKLLCIIMYVN